MRVKRERVFLARSFALYFGFLSEPSLDALDLELRENEISTKRKVLRLDQFSDYDMTVVDKLAKASIVSTYQMIEAAWSPELRESLSHRTGIEMDKIIEYLKLSDLSRLKGMKGIRVRLYFDSGIDTLDNLSSWEHEALRSMLADFVKRSDSPGIQPLPKGSAVQLRPQKRSKDLYSTD